MNRAIAVVVLLWATFAGAPSAIAQTSAPAVARPSFDANGLATAKGTAFFIRVDTGVGYAAVGTAHAFPLDQLAQTSEVHFQLGNSGERVATSKGLLTLPGRPFSEPGATLRDDYNVYALVESRVPLFAGSKSTSRFRPICAAGAVPRSSMPRRAKSSASSRRTRAVARRASASGRSRAFEKPSRSRSKAAPVGPSHVSRPKPADARRTQERGRRHQRESDRPNRSARAR